MRFRTHLFYVFKVEEVLLRVDFKSSRHGHLFFHHFELIGNVLLDLEEFVIRYVARMVYAYGQVKPHAARPRRYDHDTGRKKYSLTDVVGNEKDRSPRGTPHIDQLAPQSVCGLLIERRKWLVG